ncbi:hypothetical protein KJ590_01635, partial [Patescibacteria group bacterium]|nr:hypothetical protein [Patescibacteria group bacterium]
MNFPQLLNNKKFYILSLVILISGLFFLAGAFSVSAAECEKNQEGFSFASFLNPIASLAEKVIKNFGYDVVLAAAPDPDFCGSDSVGCSGTTPTATISWTAAPSYTTVYFQGPGAHSVSYSLNYYTLTVSGVGSWNTGRNTSYTVSSGLNKNTTYNWSVEAYYAGQPSASFFRYTNQPHGSFTTPNCVPASCTTPWGTSLASGSSVTAYSASSVPCGSTCASQTRTCTNGSLSGSYTSQSCSVAACLLTITKSGSGTVTSAPAGI